MLLKHEFRSKKLHLWLDFGFFCILCYHIPSKQSRFLTSLAPLVSNGGEPRFKRWMLEARALVLADSRLAV